ncbi:tRNA (guanosine(46)-N7)-methyltransferase TrmB [Chamaesiphon sp. OTE_20_metabat_361]|uniref:tRNA (guanosine(46)-N7)-methyltransferase TrmB n=1 Tax=Chamaesiphon sp. OTE_20_metabat_361 TaxID=2964689 RepID=UPI00286B39C9|nr:tRNA (guanosine(46)-N7)-methyltransferase TrmB [Chamaesiphon sp. OTE_20_metabat_361]
MARIKVRQHVNPLSIIYQQPLIPPDWSAIYADLSAPIHLDIGSAGGRFLLELAQHERSWNYLGIEIRQALVVQANQIRDAASLGNLHYVFGNINTSLATLLASLPPGKLQRISIQYPDPCFKTKHVKRRVVQPALVNDIARFLPSGGEVFLQSDLEWVAQEMCDRFSENPAFHRTQSDWLEPNPLAIPTERETSTLKRGLPVHRAVWIRGEMGVGR